MDTMTKGLIETLSRPYPIIRRILVRSGYYRWSREGSDPKKQNNFSQIQVADLMLEVSILIREAAAELGVNLYGNRLAGFPGLGCLENDWRRISDILYYNAVKILHEKMVADLNRLSQLPLIPGVE